VAISSLTAQRLKERYIVCLHKRFNFALQPKLFNVSRLCTLPNSQLFVKSFFHVSQTLQTATR
jgi:hypothetical protein